MPAVGGSKVFISCFPVPTRTIYFDGFTTYRKQVGIAGEIPPISKSVLWYNLPPQVRIPLRQLRLRCLPRIPSLYQYEQRSIAEDHAIWSCTQPSPFISTTSDLAWAQRVAKGMMSRCTLADPIHIAEISPDRAISGSMRYYHWDSLVYELDARIEDKDRNYHETESEEHCFEDEGRDEGYEQGKYKDLEQYKTVQESEENCFEDEEENEDYEQDQYEDLE
ncbi:hypothetical protein BYT27DRAFT_7253519 [Phlegmacium glaucopus]|nr:hypothetical protein BYT27DRAFT_7253519 [Phlegmacium glaucopus]